MLRCGKYNPPQHINLTTYKFKSKADNTIILKHFTLSVQSDKIFKRKSVVYEIQKYYVQIYIKRRLFMNKKIRTDAVDHLFDAILCLQNKEECYSFFEDLCTVNELLSLSQRFEVASMLRDHKTYLEIAEKTGASTATISRVNRSLNYGDDGYELVFNRLVE